MTVQDGVIQSLAADTNGDTVIDLKGQTVLPGFIDTHAHMMLTGHAAISLPLDKAECIHDIQDMVQTKAKDLDAGAWIKGYSLNELDLKEQRMPTKSELDVVSSRHPVFLSHATCHLCSLNSMALHIMDLPQDLSGLDKKSGNTTGVVRDPGILTHVHPKITALTTEEVKVKALHAAAHKALAAGITTVHGLDDGDLGPGDVPIILEHQDKLPIDLVVFDQVMNIDHILRLGLPRIGGCICLDGAFEAHTAALFEPYTDEPDNYGQLTYDQQTIDRFVLQAHTSGLQIAVHCESERAIEQVLGAIEKALRSHPGANHRHRIEHLELPTWNQLQRIAEAGIVASMQPAFIPAFIGQENMETYASLLGPDRLDRVHPYQSIVRKGIPLIGGSDSPVTHLAPLHGVQAAITHPNADQRLSRYQALCMFTKTAAWSAFEEDTKGTLEPGKRADFVILDKDPTAVPPDHIEHIQVTQVFVEGKSVYSV